MRLRGLVVCALMTTAATGAGCGEREPRPGTVQDEAMRAGVTAEQMVKPTDDYFHDMDVNLIDGRQPTFNHDEVAGRNMWMVWTGGNDRLWNRLTIDSLGTFDLLKTLSSHPRQAGKNAYAAPANKTSPYGGYDASYTAGYGRRNRWEYLGLVNEPCYKEATGPDPNRYGLWLDVRDPACPLDPFADEKRYPGIRIGARGKTVPVGSYYGEPSGVVGLRLFPNPDFDEAARRRWDPERYYNDPAY